MWGVKCIVRKIPVIICSMMQNPSREPKFHQIERLTGAGKEINELFKIRKRGSVFRSGFDI
ncbi:MAG: hypothetical protein SVN78_08595 [Deferribacterota bacterium]|nr:hypothetical protein [Deferribacterota bacterium]